MPGAETGAVVVNDVVQREEARPVHVFDAVNEDESERDGDENEPEEEVVEEGIVCRVEDGARLVLGEGENQGRTRGSRQGESCKDHEHGEPQHVWHLSETDEGSG